MFNWGYALIGFILGFLFGMSSPAKTQGENIDLYPALSVLAILGFLMFSASFGIEWFVMGLIEVFVGGAVGSAIRKK
jgi:hypothetical protein